MATSIPAHAVLKAGYPRALEVALVAGVLLHLGLLFLTPPLSVSPYRLPRSSAFVGVDVAEPPPEIRIPEPPKAVSRSLLAPAAALLSVPDLEEKPAVPEVAADPVQGPAPGNGAGVGRRGIVVNEVEPVVLKRVVPGYPPLAREAGAEGTVQVRVNVDERGRVTASTIVASDAVASLERAALEAAAGFLFKPALQQGNPVPFQTLLTFEFKLQ